MVPGECSRPHGPCQAPSRGSRACRALGWIGLVLVAGVLRARAPRPAVLAPPDERTGGALEAPSAAHWFGTDDLGRDLFARTAVGARLSLMVALGSVVAGLVVAVPIGLLAGYLGGTWVDDVLMRVMEALQALPVFVLALFVVGMIGTGPTDLGPVTLSAGVKVVLLLALSFLPFFARVTRAATLVEVQEEYVAALRVVGVSRRRIMLGELLPNVIPPVLVQGFLWVGVAVFAESALVLPRARRAAAAGQSRQPALGRDQRADDRRLVALGGPRPGDPAGHDRHQPPRRRGRPPSRWPALTAGTARPPSAGPLSG